LHTSQPGVSRQLLALADELGVALFRHQGKRLVGLTPAGEEILRTGTRILDDVQHISDIAARHAVGDAATLVVVSSRHAASRRVREAVQGFRADWPGIGLRLLEEEPQRALRLLLDGEAQVAVLPEDRERDERLAYVPLERWSLTLVVPRGHALLAAPMPSLARLAEHPVCCYEPSAPSRQVVDETFLQAGLETPVAYALGSSAAILDYVDGGLGIGIVAAGAFDALRWPGLACLDAGRLFPSLVTSLVVSRRGPPPEPVLALAALLAPEIGRARIERAIVQAM
jgi:DNA-binding transcriptional LysR family regulator